jgi:integrase
MDDDGLHDKTKCDRLVIIKCWYKWASFKAKPKLLHENPIAAEEVEDAESSPQPCFTPEQVAALLKNACHDHEAVIFAVMAYLGLRFGEARDLEWEDFNFDQGEHGWVTIQRGGSGKKTKGKTSRRIPVNAELRTYLDRLPRGAGRIFFQRPSKQYQMTLGIGECLMVGDKDERTFSGG